MRRWSEEERQLALSMKANGASSQQIARALGRPLEGTMWQLRKLERLGRKPCAEGTPPPGAVAPLPPPRVAGIERPAFVPSCAGGQEPVPGWLRDIRARLDWLGNAGPFTPEVDLVICEQLALGRKGAALAADLGLSLAQLRQRHIALLPDLGMQAQQRLLNELRLRAGVVA